MKASGDVQAEEKVRSVKCLPQKGKDLNLTPRTYVTILGMAVCMCNPSSGEVETGGALGTCWGAAYWNGHVPGPMGGPDSKPKVNYSRGMMPEVVLWSL